MRKLHKASLVFTLLPVAGSGHVLFGLCDGDAGPGAIRAAVNVAVSVALCVGAVAAGDAIAARVNHGATQIAQVPIGAEA